MKWKIKFAQSDTNQAENSFSISLSIKRNDIANDKTVLSKTHQPSRQLKLTIKTLEQGVKYVKN